MLDFYYPFFPLQELHKITFVFLRAAIRSAQVCACPQVAADLQEATFPATSIERMFVTIPWHSRRGLCER